ncbi:transmembrane protein 218-like [Clytia hemisphaerica]|uniref:transmembrane protein 218-like n=1 Tax=Clytia hemisphaerica TaxID=252671 RepID=UPI0034D60B13|eukprot:TCONS_00052860-protein
MGLVFGIGSGLFAIGVLWILGVVLCLLLSRSGKSGGVFGVCAFLVILTLAMVFYPREDANGPDTTTANEVVDNMAIPRILYAAFIALFFIIALLLYMVDHILMPNIALAAKVKKTYTF